MIETKREKNPAAMALGSLGGLARAKRLSKARQVEIARLGGEARRNKRLAVSEGMSK